jgi:hypothetical protein
MSLQKNFVEDEESSPKKEPSDKRSCHGTRIQKELIQGGLLLDSDTEIGDVLGPKMPSPALPNA